MNVTFNITSFVDGYDLPFIGNQTVGLFNFILMVISFGFGISTISLSFKFSTTRFMKWRTIDRFIVYEAVNEVVYYVIQICYTIHLVILKENYPDPFVCAFYAFLTNVLGFAHVLLVLAVGVSTFALVYLNKQVGLGPLDCWLHLVDISGPVVTFAAVGAMDQLGPNGYFCNFDGVKGVLAHFVIVSVGYSMVFVLIGILYVLVFVGVYRQSKFLTFTSDTENRARKRVIRIARNSSLMLLALIIQFGVYMIEGVWRTFGKLPVWLHYAIVAVGCTGGIANGIVFHVIHREMKQISPAVTTIDKV